MMIRVNELKKGNLFLCQLEVGRLEEVCTVVWLTKEGIKNQHGGMCPYNASAPIPLTPEWLERCGFEYSIDECKENNRNYIQVGNNLYLNRYLKSGNWCVEPEGWGNEQTCWLQPKYLHQLQNLFFALTGEELQIKMP